MNKADLFKQIGWSQELIDHFIIADDDDFSYNGIEDAPAQMFEATTTTIQFQVPTRESNINLLI